jgi:gamma-glutamyltranspeptidase
MSEHQDRDHSQMAPNSDKKQQHHDESSPLIAQIDASSSSASVNDNSRTKSVKFFPGVSNQSSSVKENSNIPRKFVTPSNYNLTPLKVTSGGYSRSGLRIQSRLSDSMDLTPKIKNISTMRHDDHDDDKIIPPARTKSNSHIDILQPDIEPQRYSSSSSPQYVYPNKKTATKKNVPRSIMSHLSYMVTDESSLSDDGKSPSNYSAGQDGLMHSRKNGLKVPGQKKGMKRGLLLLTVAFIIGTVAHRNYNPSDDLDDGNESKHHDEILSVHDASGKICEERYMTNHEAIMALEHTSTVKDVPHGAVSTDDARCSELAVSVMRDLHGNAMDAAVTATLCLGLVNPASSGIGGGAFILVHSTPRNDFIQNSQKSSPSFIDRRKIRNDSLRDKSKKWTEVIDCRESAPGNATFDMFEDLPINVSTIGALSIAVPGELRGLELAHARFGSLRWSDVVQPVIELAERGIYTSQILAREIMESKEKWQDFETINRIFTRNNDGKTYLEVGEIFTRPSYVETLKNVALHGADYIYKGEVAADIAKEIQEAGGIITTQDIENYKPILRDALVANVDGASIVSVPPPSSGGATIIGALRFLSGYKNPYASFADTLSIHRLVEAFKHVFAIRMSLSDPDFFSNVTDSAVQDLISGSFMEKLRKNTLDDDVLALSQYGGEWALINCTDDEGHAQDAHEGDRRLRAKLNTIATDDGHHRQRRTRLFNYLEDHGTTHLNVVDRDRNSVSITSSVNYYFGSNFASPSTGIIFNDVMDDFSTPGRPNAYGKSMIYDNPKESSASFSHICHFACRFTSCRK